MIDNLNKNQIAYKKDLLMLKQQILNDVNKLLKDVPDKSHTHTGRDSSQLKIKDIAGFLNTISSTPTNAPSKNGGIINQVVVYNDGNLKGIYIYDFTNSAWTQLTGKTTNFTFKDHDNVSHTLAFINGILQSTT